MDQPLAADVQVGGCFFCGAVEGCRRRNTPPSVRFLGRKVYLGAMVVLLTALQHGLTDRRRHVLVERLNIPQQTLVRVTGSTLPQRLGQMLLLICPESTVWTDSLRKEVAPQKM